MRWSAQTEVAVINAGAIRSDMIYPAGTTITRREVLAALPFGNRLVTIDIGGHALRTPVGNGPFRLPAPPGGVPPLHANKTYSVATIDFRARGGDDYISFREAEPVLPPADSPTIAYEV